MVNVGEENLRQIVWGAANARLNLFVAVALTGAKLPNGLEIKPTNIRGIDSHGMLCAREELSLPIIKEIDGNGLWELDNQAQGGKSRQELEKCIGFPIYHALSLNDVIIEISVTPNRPDINTPNFTKILKNISYFKAKLVKINLDCDFRA